MVISSIINIMAAKKKGNSSNKVKVFLLTGQSNMHGVGKVSQMPVGHPIQSPMANVKIWNHVDSTTKQWEDYEAGVNQQYGLTSSGDGGSFDPHLYGPEAAFGYYMAQALGETVYFIKCAFGGSVLGTSGGPKYWSKAQHDLYDIYLNEYVTPALAALVAQGKEPEIQLMFRYQGENDSMWGGATFQALLENLYDDFSTDLGITGLKWVETRLHQTLDTAIYNPGSAQNVRNGQTAFVAADTILRTLVTVDETTLNPDNVHIDGQETGQWLVGYKAAKLVALKYYGITIP